MFTKEHMRYLQAIARFQIHDQVKWTSGGGWVYNDGVPQLLVQVETGPRKGLFSKIVQDLETMGLMRSKNSLVWFIPLALGPPLPFTMGWRRVGRGPITMTIHRLPHADAWRAFWKSQKGERIDWPKSVKSQRPKTPTWLVAEISDKRSPIIAHLESALMPYYLLTAEGFREIRKAGGTGPGARSAAKIRADGAIVLKNKYGKAIYELLWQAGECRTAHQILDQLAESGTVVDQSTLTTRIIPELKSLGLVDNQPGRGYFVCHVEKVV